MSNVKVYYNSGCPLCKAGIESQRCRMAAHGVDDVVWIDVHTDPAAVNDIGASLEFVRERLHVICDDGAPQIGIDAFSALFARTPGQAKLAKLLALPLLHGLATLIYNPFARVLYWWNRALGHW